MMFAFNGLNHTALHSALLVQMKTHTENMEEVDKEKFVSPNTRIWGFPTKLNG